jgi:2-polyprenyl-3-methyl-5-hydroxy-6-metoxy-1,4-benzoquinol methylase
MANSILQPSWTKSTKSTRFNQLKKYFVGKDILDIGCAVGYKKDDWMHKHIKGQSNTIYGIDLDRDAIDEIKEKGYEVAYADAQNFNLHKKFNLIHAGELIEHLDSPGGFLDSIRNHLTDDGTVLLTTPNGLRISNFIYAATGGLKVNFQHTCWFCEYTLKTLLERKGFELIEVGYLKHETFNVFRKIALRLRTLILPDRVAWNTVYLVAKLKS